MPCGWRGTSRLLAGVQLELRALDCTPERPCRAVLYEYDRGDTNWVAAVGQARLVEPLDGLVELLLEAPVLLAPGADHVFALETQDDDWQIRTSADCGGGGAITVTTVGAVDRGTPTADAELPWHALIRPDCEDARRCCGATVCPELPGYDGACILRDRCAYSASFPLGWRAFDEWIYLPPAVVQRGAPDDPGPLVTIEEGFLVAARELTVYAHETCELAGICEDFGERPDPAPNRALDGRGAHPQNALTFADADRGGPDEQRPTRVARHVEAGVVPHERDSLVVPIRDLHRGPQQLARHRSDVTGEGPPIELVPRPPVARVPRPRAHGRQAGGADRDRLHLRRDLRNRPRQRDYRDVEAPRRDGRGRTARHVEADQVAVILGGAHRRLLTNGRSHGRPQRLPRQKARQATAIVASPGANTDGDPVVPQHVSGREDVRLIHDHARRRHGLVEARRHDADDRAALVLRGDLPADQRNGDVVETCVAGYGQAAAAACTGGCVEVGDSAPCDECPDDQDKIVPGGCVGPRVPRVPPDERRHPGRRRPDRARLLALRHVLRKEETTALSRVGVFTSGWRSEPRSR